MLELYLIRHGETPGNEWRVFYGREDYSLTDKGRAQARSAADYLKETRPAALYTSPAARALQTAEIIGDYHPYLKPVPLEDLMEMHFGLWEGLTHHEISERFPAAWHAWCEDWWSYKVPQGESAEEMFTRSIRSADEILSRHDSGSILLVGHHGPLRGILSHLLGFGKDGYWRFQLEPGTITRLTLQDGFAVLNLLNAVPARNKSI